MKLARTRPTVVQLLQVTGFNWAELEAFCGPHNVRRRVHVHNPGRNTEPDGIIGEVFATGYDAWLPFRVGDWIEHGGTGQYVPIRPGQYTARYQALHG